MSKLSSEIEKRDFLAKEIEKRIVGPGFAQDIYLCNTEAEDEIITDRPQVVYTSGILFSKKASDDTIAPAAIDPVISPNDLFGNPYDYSEDDNVDSIPDPDTHADVAGEDAEESVGLTGEFDDDLSNERGGFTPDRMGLITCLKGDAQRVKVSIRYGRYRVLKESEWCSNVHLKLDERCSLSELKATFDYYDTSAKDLLTTLGVGSVYDLFLIDEDNQTISPKVKLCYEETLLDNQKKTKYVFASSFPNLPHNRASAILLKLIQEDGKQSLESMTWDSFVSELSGIEDVPEIKLMLENNGWDSFISHLIHDSTDNSVSFIGKFKTDETKISEYLFVPDPVKDYVLDKLLEYRFFKREQVECSIDLLLNDDYGKEELGDGAILHWKSFPSKNRTSKYLRILLQNCTVPDSKSRNIPHMFQASIKLTSNKIVSYSEPQSSSIDAEFTLTEKLYSDESVYGKGVNCAVIWESCPENPSWVETTYTPHAIVRSFSTDIDNCIISDVCRVHGLTIWGDSDDVIINKLKAFADAYSTWMSSQLTLIQGDPDLRVIASQQQSFLNRFYDNIQYLEHNPRAFDCFRVANTAMYIQMLLSRDSKFKNKGRDKDTYNQSDDFYKNCWDYFIDSSRPSERPQYRPFQLAFLVINIKSIFEASDPYRNDYVDLIWFPTGGGKTEAYLALTALAIAERRSSGHTDTSGVSVIMRYTLRLLTAQQFERASYLICALDYLREQFIQRPELNYTLGNQNQRISLGMWIGMASSPNRLDELHSSDRYKVFFNEKTMDKNPFPIVYCPWCGCNLVGNDRTIGYDRSSNRKDDSCLNRGCHFHKGLPIYYVDEQLYSNPPTLLFATVDKFALLNTNKAGQLFGVGTNRRKPDLIIQDELHLISGPLGSLVGLYETFVEELASEKDSTGRIIRSPKIIASTATTRNTAHLVKQLYKRKVISFPASGMRYNDNFFSHIMGPEVSKRLYLGLSPTGHSSSELEIRTIAAELVAKERLITEWLAEKNISIESNSIESAILHDKFLIGELDLYWTQVLYYINLKTLGRTHSRISQEIKATVENMRRYSRVYPALKFILDGFFTRNTEFTSRQNSAQIKQLLVKAEEPTIIESPQPSVLRVESQMDIVQATNMISVGIDIDRWNIMIMVGQPLTTAEYIQASSRVGRHHQGLIVNLYNPNRARELSYYENYSSYHQVFYKFVEPLSATTFTEMTLDMLILNLYIGYMVLIKGYKYLNEVNNTSISEFCFWLETRANGVGVPQSLLLSLKQCVQDTHDKLTSIDTVNHPYQFKDLVGKQGPSILAKAKLNRLMNSLRVTEKNAYLKYED